MSFSHFLEALEFISLKLYPKDDPTNAFTKLLVEHIYGAFDHMSIPPNAEVYERIVNELGSSATASSATSFVNINLNDSGVL